MNRLNKLQKDKAEQFKAITGANDKNTLHCLAAGQWVVEAAIEVFYTSAFPESSSTASTSGPRLDAAALEQLYQRYRDPNSDQILAEGVGQFCSDLNVDPEDVIMLVISWHFRAATMCEYSKQEFVDGMKSLGCDSIAALTAKLPSLRAELRSEGKFKEIYDYAYKFSCEKGQKCVQLDTALAVWRLLFAGRQWPLLDDWCEFLVKHHNRAISRDTWLQLLDFTKQIKPDMSNFDGDGMSAWPYLIDEFVEYIREKPKDTEMVDLTGD
ncbi:hypothetical protein WJX72_002410 [[Myrmecia] bisecta]|uniref:Defective in cullin neddylation protein n=1 Tax=[Myrmecia] bisecta TaxID=41462 RepID=A0AAW1PWQ7_9CHLO